MTKLFLIFAIANCMISVAMGAFGAHTLRGSLEESSLRAFEVSVNYQMTHGLALLLVVVFINLWQDNRLPVVSGALFATGLLLFCGSLYTLALTPLRQLGPLPVGIITPVGGLCFIAGWFILLVAAIKH